MKLKNIVIVVKDIESSKQFYKELFGLDVILDQEGNAILTEGLVLQESKVWEETLGQKVVWKNHASELYFEETDLELFLEKLQKYEGKIVFLGDGVPVFREDLTERILKDREIWFAPAQMNRQRAASVGSLALWYYEAGKVETAAEHQPDYLRVSQAERERKERLGHDSVSM